MKRTLSICIFCTLFIVATFLLFRNWEEVAGNTLSSQKSLAAYSALSFFLLASDILLPVPSSLVMVLNGKVLGVFFGMALSLCANLISSSIGFYLGRKASYLADRLFSKAEKEKSAALFNKFGKSAIIISKGLPILSETISLLSGTMGISFQRFISLSFVGHLVVSLLYAIAGKLSLNSTIVGAVLVVTVLMTSWAAYLWAKNRTTGDKSIAASGT